MKRFVVSVLSISFVFIGLGALVERVGARFKSDEKALEIVRRARVAIGGDAALAEVRSLVISGRSVHTMKVGDQERQEPGETEIALQFPDKLSKQIRIGTNDGTGAKAGSEIDDVIVLRSGGEHKVKVIGAGEPDGKRFVVKDHPEGSATWTSEDGKKIVVREMKKAEVEAGAAARTKEPGHPGADSDVVIVRAGAGARPRQNDLLKLSLSLLLRAPNGGEVNYTFAGESDIDGTAVNVINAEFAGSTYKLFIGKASSLPVGISYRGLPMPHTVKFKREGNAPAGSSGDNVIFTKKLDDLKDGVEHLVKFSDYRTTGGVALPYRWTTTVGGVIKEVFDVTSFDLNPANIAERFSDKKVFVRTKKADGQ